MGWQSTPSLIRICRPPLAACCCPFSKIGPRRRPGGTSRSSPACAGPGRVRRRCSAERRRLPAVLSACSIRSCSADLGAVLVVAVTVGLELRLWTGLDTAVVSLLATAILCSTCRHAPGSLPGRHGLPRGISPAGCHPGQAPAQCAFTAGPRVTVRTGSRRRVVAREAGFRRSVNCYREVEEGSRRVVEVPARLVGDLESLDATRKRFQ